MTYLVSNEGPKLPPSIDYTVEGSPIALYSDINGDITEINDHLTYITDNGDGTLSYFNEAGTEYVIDLLALTGIVKIYTPEYIFVEPYRVALAFGVCRKITLIDAYSTTGKYVVKNLTSDYIKVESTNSDIDSKRYIILEPFEAVTVQTDGIHYYIVENAKLHRYINRYRIIDSAYTPTIYDEFIFVTQSVTVTLPALSSVPIGTHFTIVPQIGAGYTLICSGSDQLKINTEVYNSLSGVTVVWKLISTGTEWILTNK